MIKNIVYVYDQAYISGGAAKIVIGEAVAMKRLGYNVIYFSAVKPVCNELTDAGVQVICLDEKHIAATKNPFALAKGIWNRNAYNALSDLLETLPEQETVVHIHGWTKALSSSVFSAAHKRGVRVFFTLHEYFTVCPNGGFYNYRRGSICHLEPDSAKCRLCNCDKRNYLHKIYRNVRQLVQNTVLKKCSPNPIYITRFSREIIEKNIPVKSKAYFLTNHVEISEKPRIEAENNSKYIYIGRVSAEKGIDLFCEAVRRTSSEGVVIGNGPLAEEYKKLYPEIIFAGWKSTAEMQEYLSQARALVVSSKWYETMGLTIIEMQQYGIPCIVPKQCAGSEYVSDGETGLLYEIGSVESLCSAIEKMQNSDFVKKLSENFRNSLDIDAYSMETHIAELIRIYEEE